MPPKRTPKTEQHGDELVDDDNPPSKAVAPPPEKLSHRYAITAEGPAFNLFYHEEQSADSKYESRVSKHMISREIDDIEYCNDHVKIFPELHLINEFIYLTDDNSRILQNENDLYIDSRKLGECTREEIQFLVNKTRGKIHSLLPEMYSNHINYSRLTGVHFRVPKPKPKDGKEPKDSTKKDKSFPKYWVETCEIGTEIRFENGSKWYDQFLY
jgi:hypothetical protein